MTLRELVERIALGVGAVDLPGARPSGSACWRSTSRGSRDALPQDDVQFPDLAGAGRTLARVPRSFPRSRRLADRHGGRRRAAAVRCARSDSRASTIPPSPCWTPRSPCCGNERAGAARRDRRGRLRIAGDEVARGRAARRDRALAPRPRRRRIASRCSRATVANLQFAIALDASNDEAKYNLELALQRSRGVQLNRGRGRPEPDPGGSGSSGAGAGEPCSGY